MAPPSRIAALVLALGLAPSAPALAQLPAARLGELERRAAADIATLSRDEVLELAKSYEGRAEPDRARDLKRRWLDDQRLRLLDATDVAGRIALARQYESMLGDPQTAAVLLRDALRIEPGSPDVVTAFRNMGYREVDGQWVAPETPRSAPSAAVVDPLDDSLRGAIPSEVIAKMGGPPNRIARSASQGRILEQWIYQGTGVTHYINFFLQPGSSTARVAGRYSLP